jgi:hypothetical protein
MENKMSDTPEFVDGLIIKAPHEKAPDFVKAAISIKRSELITWLSTRTEDWINLDVKESKKGPWYASVNDWKPSKQDVTAQQNQPSSGSNQGQQTAAPANQLDDDFDVPF